MKNNMSRKKEDYKQKAETQPQNNYLQTDNRMYYDPIYQSWMQGDFYRDLLKSPKAPRLKVLFSIFVCIVPAIGADIIFTVQYTLQPNPGNVMGLVFVYLYSALALFVSVKIGMAGIRQLMKRR